MVEQTFLPLQIKGNVTNLYVRVASRVAQGLNTLDFRKLGNIREILKLYRLSAQSFSQNENFLTTNRNRLKNRS